jgi:hypothetical protein
MKRKGFVLSVATIAWIGIMGWVVKVHPQAEGGQVPAAPGQQPGAPAAAPRGAGGAQRGGGGLQGTESGWSTFQTRCSICHSNPGPNQGPTAEAIRLMTPEKIAEALTTGKMKTQGSELNEGQIRRVAEFMSGRPMGSSGPGDAKNMPNKCATNPHDPRISTRLDRLGVSTTATRASRRLAVPALRRHKFQPQAEMGVWVSEGRNVQFTAYGSRRARFRCQ